MAALFGSFYVGPVMDPMKWTAKITGFHLDDDGHWVAELGCGHQRHVRHVPPFQERPWVATEAGRYARICTEIECMQCRDIANDGS
jgi:hypothetical protein